MDTVPKPIPVIMRPKIKMGIVGARAIIKEPIRKSMLAKIRAFFLPILSAIVPPRGAPIIALRKSELIITPSRKGDTTNCFLIKRIAPDITAVS